MANDPQSDLPKEFERLTQADWEILLTDLLSSSWMQTQIEGVIDQFFAYVNHPGSELSIKVSMVEFKQRLQGQAGVNAILRIIRAQPSCDSAEWAAILSSQSGANFDEIPLCCPPDEILKESEPYIQEALDKVALDIPDETSLAGNETPQSSSGTSDGRKELQQARTIILLSPCLPMLFLVLIALFGVRSLKGWLLWWGVPFLLTGMGGFIMAALIWFGPGWIISASAPGGKVVIEGVATGLTQVIVDIGISIAHSTATTMGLLSIALGMAGFFMVAVSFFFPSRTREYQASQTSSYYQG
jgi:hypothetical protein